MLETIKANQFFDYFQISSRFSEISQKELTDLFKHKFQHYVGSTYVCIYTPFEVKEAAYLCVAIVNPFANIANLTITCATT